MKDESIQAKIEPPRIYLVHMVVSILVAVLLGIVVLPALYSAFVTNPLLNALILFAFLYGTIHYLRLVLRLFREVRSVNEHSGSAASSSQASPELVGLMAMVLRDRAELIFHPGSMSSLSKSLTSGPDNTHEMKIYRVLLPSAIALTGIVWGVFSAIGSFQESVEAVDLTSEMGLDHWKSKFVVSVQSIRAAFASLSLGLLSSLMLAYLHVKSGQVQSNINRQVYAELLMHLKKSLDSERP